MNQPQTCDNGHPMTDASVQRPMPEVDEQTRLFSASVVVSGIRCLLTYIVLPFVLPLVGLSDAIGPVVGLAVGSVAIAANIWSIQRFWRSDHRLKWPVTVISAGILVLLFVLVVQDLNELFG